MPNPPKRRPEINSDSPRLLDDPAGSDDELLIPEAIELALAVLDDDDDVPESSRLGRVLIGVFILVLCLIMAALLIITATIRELNTPLRDQATQLAGTLEATVSADRSERDLRGTLDFMRAEANRVAGALATLQPGFFDWASAMRSLGVYNPDTLTLTGIAEQNSSIVINGQGDDEETVMAYAEALRSAPQFSRVVIQSMNLRMVNVSGANGGELVQRQIIDFILTIDVIRGTE